MDTGGGGGRRDDDETTVGWGIDIVGVGPVGYGFVTVTVDVTVVVIGGGCLLLGACGSWLTPYLTHLEIQFDTSLVASVPSLNDPVAFLTPVATSPIATCTSR